MVFRQPMVDKTRKFGFLAIGLAGLLVLALVVCGCTQQPTGGPAPTPTAGEHAPEMISVDGSTTVLPIAQKTAEAFMDANSWADIQVTGGGSSVGVQKVGEGTASIGMASRDLKSSEAEKYPNLVQYVIAKDGIAVIVHTTNPVSDLTIAQLKSIYKGEITNWKDLGGSDAEIVVVGRDSASGTREVFSELVMDKEDFTPTQLEKNSNGAVKQTIVQTPGAIGYVGLGYIDDTVKAIVIEGVAPSIPNVLDGRYKISRSLNLFTEGEATGLAKEYIDYILSDEGQKIVEDEGFVPVV